MMSHHSQYALRQRRMRRRRWLAALSALVCLGADLLPAQQPPLALEALPPLDTHRFEALPPFESAPAPAGIVRNAVPGLPFPFRPSTLGQPGFSAPANSGGYIPPQPYGYPPQLAAAPPDSPYSVVPAAAWAKVNDQPEAVSPSDVAPPNPQLPPATNGTNPQPPFFGPPALSEGALLPQEDFVIAPSQEEAEYSPLLRWPIDPPLGYAGPSGIAPREQQQNSHFVPMEDRWRIGFPEWDRYSQNHPALMDYPYVKGDIRDPYRQNVLKGDYPILGQHNFFTLTVTEQMLMEARQVPTPNSPFESTPHPNSEEFFGDPDQFLLNNNLIVSTDWVHGDAGFKQPDWRVKLTQIFNVNHLVVDELGVVGPDVRSGTSRTRTDYALEEWFVESKLADLSPDFDFASARVGSQFFNSDFKGFLFADTNRMLRLFGTQLANRDQFNLIWVDQTEKQTNSLLNTFDDRHQNTLIANYYRQDFIWPGYTTTLSYHYNKDEPSLEYDANGFLVRPDPTGVATPHEVNVHYLGWGGDGHINRFNITHQMYYALGKDELNPIAGAPQNINALMAAIELSYDRDWMRFRTSYFYSSGDDDPFDTSAEGFDTIFDAPIFAGGNFSYWNRQQVKLFGVNLVQRQSLVPNLRSSKFQGQANFVNPGLHLINFGVDADLTPRWRTIANANLLWFDKTDVLDAFVFQPEIRPFIGADLSIGTEYRPRLNNNVIFLGGISTLIPAGGFNDLYNPLVGQSNTLVGAFVEAIFTY